jgi:hypothetical protein
LDLAQEKSTHEITDQDKEIITALLLSVTNEPNVQLECSEIEQK